MSTQPSIDKVKKYQYVPFKVERELWARYRLEDGTILKMKIVLVNVKTSPSLVETLEEARETKKAVPIHMQVQIRNVIGVETPPDVRGIPDEKTYSSNELAESIAQPDLAFEREDRTTWISEYELEGKVRLKVQNTLMDVSKTSKYDSIGDPLYIVDSTANIKIMMPKRYRPTKIRPSIKRVR